VKRAFDVLEAAPLCGRDPECGEITLACALGYATCDSPAHGARTIRGWWLARCLRAKVPAFEATRVTA